MLNKERPILFNEPMVHALLAGRKTQIRRVVKCPKGMEDIWQDGQGHFDIQPRYNKPGYEMWDWETDECNKTPLVCPNGRPGDRLWVKETFRYTPQLETKIKYRADYGGSFLSVLAESMATWKPSIHMPRAASRILLEIKAVRCERLQDISEADAVAEGYTGYRPSQDEPTDQYRRALPVNGPGAWATNPWVWVVEFQRVDA